MTLHRFWDICIRQEHGFVVTLLNGMNHLWETEAVDVMNIVHTLAESRGTGQLEPRRWRLRVKEITAMPYCAGGAYGHHFPLAVDLSNLTQLPQENAP